MKTFLMILTALTFVFGSVSCANKKVKTAASDRDKKIIIDVGDVVVEGANLQIPLKVACVEGRPSATLQIGDFYKTFTCEGGGFSYMHELPATTLKENRKKKKDYVLRIRAFHEDKKAETLTQSLIIISNKDFQAKLVVNQSLVQVAKLDGIFSDLNVIGQCKEGSNVEVEIFNDISGKSMEEESLACSETGFTYFSRRPGLMKPGMRLLIRQMKNEKPVSSFEVVLFN